MIPPKGVAIRTTVKTVRSTLHELEQMFPALRWGSGSKPSGWCPIRSGDDGVIFLCIDELAELTYDTELPSDSRLINMYQLKSSLNIRKELTS